MMNSIFCALPSTTRGGFDDPSGGSMSMQRSGTATGSIGENSFVRSGDEPEVDYDEGATDLYRKIEGKDWDGAIARAESHPMEAKTWVYRQDMDQSSPASKLRWRLLPIHATCVFRSPLSLIEALLQAYPDGPQMKDDQGMLPLHLACRNGASKGVVLTLLQAFPNGMTIKDKKGRIPIQLVEASESQNKEAVMLVLRRFQADGGVGGGSIVTNRSEKEVDYEHRTVLFRLILKKDWQAALSRSNAYPDEAATWIVTKGFNGNLRFLPLHKACVLNPPEDLVSHLVTSYPEGGKSKDQDGWLPIHCACFYGASEAVVSTLLASHPKGAQCKDDEGRLPIHYACLKNAPLGVITALLSSFPKGSMSKDDEGRLPIHHACSKGASDAVIESLLKTSPKGAQSKDDQGRLPIHHACRKHCSPKVVNILLKVHPRGAQVKDDQDKLPIHYACQNGAPAAVVHALLVAHPESIHAKNGFGYTPLAEAKAMENPKMEPIIHVLEKFQAEQDVLKAESSGAVGGTSGGGRNGESTAALQAKVGHLTQRVLAMEQTLVSLSRFAKDLKQQQGKKQRNGDNFAVFSKEGMNQLVDKLAAIDIKATQSSGSGGGMFGLGRRGNNEKKESLVKRIVGAQHHSSSPSGQQHRSSSPNAKAQRN